MTLHPALGPLAGETPASVTSRNAMRHRAPTAREFCLDFRLSFQDVVDAKPVALERLSELLRVPVDDLSRGAIVRTGTGHAFREQELVRHSLRRSHVMFCPRCASEDLVADGQPGSVAGRAVWQLDPIRVCALHGVALADAGCAQGPSEVHDFARNVAGILPGVARMADEARDVAPTGLEAYLLARIDGAVGPAWLDALPWHAAARVCEMIGAVALDGPLAPIKGYGGPEWRCAGEAGHELAAEGVGGIRRFLDRMRTACPIRHIDNGGPQAWWGRLHTWLTDALPEAAYDPLRGVILGYVSDSVPVGPGYELYGRPVVEARRLHTVRTASLETGLHPKHLRKILAREGLLPEGHEGQPDDGVVFAADDAAEVLRRMHRAIGHAEAGFHLNAGRVQMEVLLRAGFIETCAASKEDGLRSRTYDPDRLDAFLAAILEGAVAMQDPELPFVGIPEAAKRASCGAAEVVRLILDRRLARIGGKVGDRGYASVLVDYTEVREAVRGDYGSDVNLRAVERELGTSTRVVGARRDREAPQPARDQPAQPVSLRGGQDGGSAGVRFPLRNPAYHRPGAGHPLHAT